MAATRRCRDDSACWHVVVLSVIFGIVRTYSCCLLALSPVARVASCSLRERQTSLFRVVDEYRSVGLGWLVRSLELFCRRSTRINNDFAQNNTLKLILIN